MALSHRCLVALFGVVCFVDHSARLAVAVPIHDSPLEPTLKPVVFLQEGRQEYLKRATHHARSPTRKSSMNLPANVHGFLTGTTPPQS